MDRLDTLMTALHAYCQRHGLRPDSVVRAATGNPRLYDRLHARQERMHTDIARIAAHIGMDLSDGGTA